MSSVYEFYKRKTNFGNHTSGNSEFTLGDKLKTKSDQIMESTWNNDIQSKKAYIYDYFHDDQPEKKSDMTYENTTKTAINVKFIVKSYQSVDKDQVEFYLQFKPSQKFEFDQNDDLYYFETDYKRKYKMEFPIGLYIDIPNSRGTYEKWLIVDKEYSNQFQKFLILPCDYQLTWVEKRGQNRVKRKMWSVLRNQNSYTIGTYTDRYFTHSDNQNKIWLPLNKFTERFWYNDDTNKTMRLVMSAPTEHPLVWAVTKIENTKPIGLQKLTIYQNFWNNHTDYIEKDKDGNIIGMYANYLDSEILPDDIEHLVDDLPFKSVRITSSTQSIKVGGSYKTFSVVFYSEDNEDITEDYSDYTYNWSCVIDEEYGKPLDEKKEYLVDENRFYIIDEVCNNVYSDNKDYEVDYTEKVNWLSNSTYNKIKMKLPNDKSLLGKVMKVQCVVSKENEKTIIVFDYFEITN